MTAANETTDLLAASARGCPQCRCPVEAHGPDGCRQCGTCDLPQRTYVRADLFEHALRRLERVEKMAHVPYDFSALIARIERLEKPIDSRDAIAWELGFRAHERGDDLSSNPFRKAH